MHFTVPNKVFCISNIIVQIDFNLLGGNVSWNAHLQLMRCKHQKVTVKLKVR